MNYCGGAVGFYQEKLELLLDYLVQEIDNTKNFAVKQELRKIKDQVESILWNTSNNN